MVNNHIRVYARIKKEINGHKARYDVIANEEEYDIMKVYNSGSSFKRKRRTFRFNKVFPPHSTQEDIFNVIAKPIIHDVFEGLNATIFAYGATGSGKTYTLTGSQTKYDERGLIPRTIEYIFKLVTNNMSNYMFFISYLEIYNENAYDLLNPKQNFTCLEELPRVVVLEDEKGEAHFKNLCLKEVNTEKEAMRLLYSGDNNSSERLHRMNLHGMTLNEARHINLSLHYLERVIQALSHKGKNHVPYRNSMMTFILRDSLGGNCLTAMLATLSMLHLNIDETISTCKFAQRVCLIKLDVNVNFVPTPEKEIHYLRNELKRLRRQMGEKNNLTKKLTRDEEEECNFAVQQFLLGKDDLIKLGDARKVKYYIECMRDKLRKLSATSNAQDSHASGVSVKSVKDIEKKYQQLIEQKDEEINILMSVYDQRIDTKALFKPISNDSLLNGSRMDAIEKKEFRKYLNKSQLKGHYDNCIKQIKVKYHEAVKISQTLTNKQKQIAVVKRTLAKNTPPNQELTIKLNLDQSFYREQLRKMHNIKGDIEDLKHNMSKIKLKIMDEYKVWCYTNGHNAFPSLEEKNPGSRKRQKCFCLSHNVPQGDFQASSYSSASENEQHSSQALPTAGDLPPHRSDLTKLTKPEQVSPMAMKRMIFNYHMRESSTQLPELDSELLSIKDDRLKCDHSLFSYSSDTMSTSVKLKSSKKSLDIPQSQQLASAFRRFQIPTAAKNLRLPMRTSSLVIPCSCSHSLSHSHSHDVTKTHKKELRRPQSPRSGVTSISMSSSPQFSLLQCKSADYICNKNLRGRRNLKDPPSSYKFIQSEDTPDFITYLKAIPLTGDDDVDEEIVKFYRLKYKRREIKSLVRK